MPPQWQDQTSKQKSERKGARLLCNFVPDWEREGEMLLCDFVPHWGLWFVGRMLKALAPVWKNLADGSPSTPHLVPAFGILGIGPSPRHKPLEPKFPADAASREGIGDHATKQPSPDTTGSVVRPLRPHQSLAMSAHPCAPTHRRRAGSRRATARPVLPPRDS